jgi:hypothetical protein
MEDWAPLGSQPEFQGTPPPLNLPPASSGDTPAVASALAEKKARALLEEFHPSQPDSDPEAEATEGAEQELQDLPPPPNTPAWENGKFFRSPLTLVRTALEVLFVPQRAFRNLDHEGHWRAPLIYALVGCAIGWLSFFETAFLLAAHDPNVPAKMLENFRQLPKATFWDLLVPSLLLSGLLGPIVLLGAACCLHGALAITGAARRSLATTYRLAAYLLGTFTLAMCLLPASVRIAVAWGHPEQSGFWVSDLILVLGVWAVVCTLRGAATAHHAHLARVFVSLIFLLLSVLIPPLLFLLRIAEMTLMGS